MILKVPIISRGKRSFTCLLSSSLSYGLRGEQASSKSNSSKAHVILCTVIALCRIPLLCSFRKLPIRTSAAITCF